jgi:biopolymer transport protein ExbD
MSASSKKKGMPHVHGSEVNVTPLIDVIMCLIIFFMLVAKIGVTKGEEPMSLPVVYLHKTIQDLGNTLTLNLCPVGDDVQVVALVDSDRRELPISIDVGGVTRFPLQETLVQMKARYREQFKVIVRADGNLPFTSVRKVLIECANAGASSLYFAGQKGQEPPADTTPVQGQ